MASPSVRYRTDTAASQGHAWFAFSLRPGEVPRGTRWIAYGPEASVPRSSAYQGEIEIRTHCERPARMPIWIAAISTCLLVASGIVAIARPIPASYANIPDEGTPSKDRAAPGASEDAQTKNLQAPLALARVTINRRNRAWCPECGVVESVRQIDGSGDAGGRDNVDVTSAGNAFVRASGSAIAVNTLTGKTYEFTVRFRDGSMTVFNEATPRTWRSGSPVIVIARSNATNN